MQSCMEPQTAGVLGALDLIAGEWRNPRSVDACIRNAIVIVAGVLPSLPASLLLFSRLVRLATLARLHVCAHCCRL